MDALPIEHYQALGMFVVSFARLEALLEEGIWRMLDLKFEDGRIITSQMPAGAKLQLAKTLLANKHKEADCKVLFDNLLSLIGHRNFLIHGVWGAHPNHTGPVALSVKPKTADGFVVGQAYPIEKMGELIVVSEHLKNETRKLFDALVPSIDRKSKSDVAPEAG